MAIFKSSREREYLARLEELARTLTVERAELEETQRQLDLLGEYERTKKALVDKQIELDRVREDHARETREIEHKIGLHKIQVEQEMAAAKKEAELGVREEALNAERSRFSQEMEFIKNRMTDEIESQRNLMNQILDRLPKFDRSYSTVEHIGTPPTQPPTVKLELEK